MGRNSAVSVIYHTADGPQTLRFIDPDMNTIVDAANRLKSARFLMPDPEQRQGVKGRGLVTWGLFETAKCSKFIRDQWSLAVPTATWDLGDDAVGVLEMYMMHRSAAGS